MNGLRGSLCLPTALLCAVAVAMPAVAERVPLRQTSASTADAAAWPMVTGVPLPEGGLADASQARLLDAQGRELPAHFEAVAHWSPARDSIKWLRVIFNAPSVAGSAPEYVLEYAGETRVTPPAVSVRVADGVDAVVVDTGAVVLTISKKTGAGLVSVMRADKDVFKCAADDGPYVVDHTGALFRAALDTTPAVVIEEANALRAVVRVESWHVRDLSGATPKGPSPAGEKLNKSIQRFYAYAGQPWVELDWTFIITADTEAVQFRDIGLKLTGTGRGMLGLEGGRETEAAEGYLLQKKSDLYVVRTAEAGGFKETAKGANGPGWAAAGEIMMAMRDFAPMFPKEIELRPGARAESREMILHAWPGHGEYNQDWFIEPDPPPGPDVPVEKIAGPNGVGLSYEYFMQLQKFQHGPLLDFRYPDWWRGPQLAGDPKNPKEKYWLDANLTGSGGHRPWEFFTMWSTAIMPKGIVKETAGGAARTQEVLLDFSGEGADALAGRRGLFEARPHVWLKDPEWLNRSRALGPMNVRASRLWLAPAARGWEMVEKDKHVGMWACGNMPEWFNADGTFSVFRMIGCTGAHYGFFNTDWLLYMTTLDAPCLTHARANTTQWRDVEIVHYALPEWADLSGSPRILGSSHTCSPYPWRLGAISGFCGGVSPLLFDFYLTGNRRSLEAAALYAYRATMKTDHYGVKSFGREAAGEMKTLLDWYAHSWDPAFASQLDGIVGRCLANDPTTFLSKSSTPLNWTNWMPQYLELTRNAAVPLTHRDGLRAFVLKWVEDDLDTDVFETGYPGNPGNLLAAAWFETGDTKYLMPFVRNVVKRRVAEEKLLLIRPRKPGSSGEGVHRLDDALYAYAAWQTAVDRKLIPASEAELPAPAETGYFRLPCHPGFKSVDALFLKEAGKELRVRFGSDNAGIPAAFYAPDGKKVAEAVTAEGRFVPAELVAPADAPFGVYRFEATTSPANRYVCIRTVNKHVVPLKDYADLAGVRDWYYAVPAGVRKYTAEFQPFNKGATLLTPDWRPVPGPKEYGPFQVTVPEGADGKLWRVRPPEWDGWFVWAKLEGVPPYVAIRADFWFNPDAP